MVFFNTAPPPIRTLADCEQLSKVIEFKDELKADGLISEYSDLRDFEAMVTRYLLIECLGTSDAERFLSSPVWCRVVSSPVEVRPEGRAEHVGDLRLFFGVNSETLIRAIKQSGAALQPPQAQLVDVDLQLNTTIVWHAGGTGPVLVLGGMGEAPQQRLGRRIASNRIRFEDVPIGLGFLGTTAIIANIRVDALRIGIAATGVGNEIFAAVTARDGYKDVVITNQTVTLAFLHRGPSVTFSVSPRWPRLARAHVHRLSESNSEEVSPTLTAQISEEFLGALKTRTEEAGITALSADQVANSGTRLMLALQGIPDGLDVYAAVHDHGDGTEEVGTPSVQLIQVRPDILMFPKERWRTGLTSSHGVGLAQLDVAERAAVAVWEWVSIEPPSLRYVRQVRLDIVFAASKDAVVGTGTITGTILLAPQSHERETDSLPVPCFGVFQSYVNLLSIE
jgi:hypothetical protein